MKWIILEAFAHEDGLPVEWEVAGTVMASTPEEAIEKVHEWGDLRRPLHLQAVEWASAAENLRADAIAEDETRRTVRKLREPPVPEY